MDVFGIWYSNHHAQKEQIAAKAALDPLWAKEVL
jgi:hypothetical protein